MATLRIITGPNAGDSRADTVPRIGAPVDVASMLGPAATGSTARASTLFCLLPASAAARVSVTLGGA